MSGVEETGDTKLSLKVEIPRSAEVNEMKADRESLRKQPVTGPENHGHGHCTT